MFGRGKTSRTARVRACAEMSRQTTKPARALYRPQAGLDMFLTQEELEQDQRRTWIQHMNCKRRTLGLIIVVSSAVTAALVLLSMLIYGTTRTLPFMAAPGVPQEQQGA